MARLSIKACEARGDVNTGSHMVANETAAADAGGQTRSFTLGASSAWKGDLVQTNNLFKMPANCEPNATGM